jgi:hypothetical protein
MPDSLQTRQHLYQGWNLVSVARQVLNNSSGGVYPAKVANIFSYNTSTGTYDAAPNVTNGSGYWVNYGIDAPAFNIVGVATSRIMTVPVAKAGWVLVGSRAWPIKVIDLQFSNGASPVGSVFIYNPVTKSYQSKTVINPGEAVWMNVQGASSWPCTITFQ